METVVLTSETAEVFGVLVVHQLNTLFSYSCCRRCCAPCSALWDLANDGGKLELIMQRAPVHLWHDWLHEDNYKPEVRERDGRISREWLDSRMQGMDDEPCPNHEEVPDGTG